MNKELTPLEALESLRQECKSTFFDEKGKQWWTTDKKADYRCNIIETALKRIPSLEKALKEEIDFGNKLNIEHYEKEIVFAKEHKALEIIVKKNVKIDILKYQSNVVFYNMAVFEKEEELTQEEFDLLKRELL